MLRSFWCGSAVLLGFMLESLWSISGSSCFELKFFAFPPTLPSTPVTFAGAVEVEVPFASFFASPAFTGLRIFALRFLPLLLPNEFRDLEDRNDFLLLPVLVPTAPTLLALALPLPLFALPAADPKLSLDEKLGLKFKLELVVFAWLLEPPIPFALLFDVLTSRLLCILLPSCGE